MKTEQDYRRLQVLLHAIERENNCFAWTLTDEGMDMENAAESLAEDYWVVMINSALDTAINRGEEIGLDIEALVKGR